MKTIYLPLLLLLGTLGVVVAQDIKVVPIANNDILYVPSEDRIYVSTPSGGPGGNCLCAIDPYFGTVEDCYFVGSEPGAMALSDDGQFIYVAMRGAPQVVRFSLEFKTISSVFGLGDDPFFGPRYAEDIEVLPGQPNSIAVSMYRQGVSPRHSGVAIVDNGVLRANTTQDHTGSNSIAFAGNTLYGYNNETTEFGVRRLAISAAGVSEAAVFAGLISGFDNKIEAQGTRLYARGGEVLSVSGATPQLVGTAPVSNPFLSAVEPAPDSNVVYFVSHGFFDPTFRFETFDKTTLSSLSSFDISGMVGNVHALIHWGGGGKLAYNTPQQVVLLRSCTSTVTASITISAPTTVACDGQTVTLNGPAGWDRYFWSNGATTQNIEVTQTGAYTLAIPDATGCLGAPSNTIIVAVEAALPPPFLSEQGTVAICQGEAAILTAFHSFMGESYSWSNGATSQTIEVTQPGNYFAASVSANGCVGLPSEAVAVIARNESAPAQPTVTASGATTLCQGSSVVLTAPAGFAQYIWSNGATTPAITVTESGNYSVQVVNAAGCASPTSVLVPVSVFPVPDQPSIFQNGNLLASSSIFGNQWFLNGSPIAGANEQFYSPTVSGFYSVQVSANGCSSAMSALLNFVLVATDSPTGAALAKSIVYPNPTSDWVRITYPSVAFEQEVAALRLIDATGRYALQSADIHQLDVAGLPAGLYIIQWLDATGQLLDRGLSV